MGWNPPTVFRIHLHKYVMKKAKPTMILQDQQIWELTSKFNTEAEIAAKLGLDQSNVNRSIRRTAAKMGEDRSSIEELRSQMKSQLETILSETYTAWTKAQREPNSKNTLYLNTNLKAMERLCKMLGVDAPIQVQSDNTNRTVTDVFADARIELGKESCES